MTINYDNWLKKTSIVMGLLVISMSLRAMIDNPPAQAQTPPPTLMFTIMKDGECKEKVNAGDVVNIRVHRTSGANNITNITVNGSNTGVTVGPAPITGQSITNVTLTQSTQFTVTGTNNGVKTFSPWCGDPSNGSATSGYVTVNPGLTAIACSTKAYYVQGSPSNTSYLDLSQSQATVQHIGNTTGYINGAGFNANDGFFYGVKPSAPDQGTPDQGTLYRFDENGHTRNMGKVLPDSSAEYTAGDFVDGFLYVLEAGGNRLFKVDVRPDKTPSERLNATITTSRYSRIADIAYNPSDGMLYGFDSYNPTNSNRFVRINPSSGVVEDLSFDFPSIGSVAHGAAWFYGTDYYSYSNNGVIYKIENMRDYSSGNKMVTPPAVWKSVTNAANNSNDGMVCSSAQPPYCSINATSYNITPGQPTKLYWTSSLAVGATLTAPGFSQNVSIRQDNPPGYEVTPSVTTKYTLTVIGSFGVEGKCETTITVQPPPDKPYFKITGNDAHAGGTFDNGNNNCAGFTNNGATFRGFNNNLAGGFTGAGAQFALFALGTIDQVASANLRTPPLTSATRETFASNTNPPWGGTSNLTRCIPNYIGSHTSTLGGPTISSMPPIAPNEAKVDYYIGDVFISGSMINNISSVDLKNYTLIVDGNIYIGSGVTQLDGLFIAQNKSNPTKGVIYTCSTGIGLIPNQNDLRNECDNSTLIVNGALIGRIIKPLRTGGNLSSSPAEIFNFGPEFYLNPPDLGGGGTSSDKYDSIETLAPVF